MELPSLPEQATKRTNAFVIAFSGKELPISWNLCKPLLARTEEITVQQRMMCLVWGQLVLLLLAGCSRGAGPLESTTLHTSQASTTGSVRFQLDAWADNWFAVYLDDQLLAEDVVPITTERSFNAETVTFQADYPLHLNFILKDYKENDTGLEYIGAQNQQMGDGGFIMQLTDLTSKGVVAVSNGEWACTVINIAPLDKTCETVAAPVAGTAPCEFTELGEPVGWKSQGFDDSNWRATRVYSANEVGPKDGYDQIPWDADAKLIWGTDLETDNTLLCRITVTAAGQE